MSLVEIRGLSKSFGKTPVFDGIDLNIERGEVCVLVGPSGCGKTTLLRVIAGLATPDTGTISINRRDVLALSPHLRGIAMVFQNYALFPNMTVEQNIAFGLEQKSGTDGIASKVSAMIELMGLEARAKARPAALSGGQKQRVALARALVLEPALLLLDEPLSALDAQIRKRLQDEFKRLQARVGFTAVFVTHDQEEALVLGDRIAVMQGGRFIQVGTPHQVYGSPANRAVAGFIGNVNIVERQQIRLLFGQASDHAWALHPEAICVGGDGAGRISVQVMVQSRTTLGSTLRYVVQAKGVALRMDVLNRPSVVPLEPGTQTMISLDPADIRRLAD